jgi:hypothetical protein
MTRRARFLTVVAGAVLAFFLVVPGAFAHVPQFTEGGTDVESATVIDQPAVSRVYYGSLDGSAGARYYRVDLAAGERLYVQLLTPRSGPFPGLAVMGPGLAAQGGLPAFVDVPSGAIVIAEQGTADKAEYEPFTPGAYWYPSTFDTRVPQAGSYYVAIFSEQATGPFAIAVGYAEEYTVPEWIRLPADLMTIYAWDGGWPSALWPGIAVLIVGGALVAWRLFARQRRLAVFGWLTVAAGIVCLTTSATVLFQMLRGASRSGPQPEMAITAMFIIAPAVIAVLLLWLGWRTAGIPSVFSRIGALVLGLAAVGLLAGYFIGPVLAILAAIAPPYRASTSVAPAKEQGETVPQPTP